MHRFINVRSASSPGNQCSHKAKILEMLDPFLQASRWREVIDVIQNVHSIVDVACKVGLDVKDIPVINTAPFKLPKRVRSQSGTKNTDQRHVTHKRLLTRCLRGSFRRLMPPTV